ncbi:MAG: class I SAM-dependent methyltransferase [Proteobacteria bacterium]|nr:class I SAM-dependent methyltransferase [Pseudomonadota bacterium]
MESSEQTAAADAARIDAVWGDPADWQADGLHWQALPAIRHAINRRVTGSATLTPLAWFFDRLRAERELPIERALVLACWDGKLERRLVLSGWVREIVAIDLSPRVLEHAAAAARAAGLSNIRYVRADMNRLELDEPPFDVVFSVAAIHHCAALEQLCDAVTRLLKPDGWFYLDEYVGPSRFQWTDAQMRQVNLALDLLPDDLVRTAKGQIRRHHQRVSAEVIAAHDPSEAVRSAEIPGVVGQRFELVEQRGYGGGLLHLQLAQIAQNFLAPHDTARAARYLELLIEAEDALQRAGRIVDDFAVMLARRRR